MTTRALTLYDTSIGMKVVMAVSGAIMLGYLIGHVLGNLLVFLGPNVINAYAQTLHTSPVILWGTRTLLLVSVVAHIGSAVRLTTANQAARPVRYHQRKDVATTYAARTMVWSGPVLAFFILFHLAHLTFGAEPGGGYTHDPSNVYGNLVGSFQVPWVAAVYVLSMVAVGLHLFHGAWSMFNSLGANHPKYNPAIRRFATIATLIITLGFISIPVAILAGIVG